MALVTTKEMFKKAYEGGYAVGAFNAENMEMALDALHKSPVFSAEHLKRLFG